MCLERIVDIDQLTFIWLSNQQEMNLTICHFMGRCPSIEGRDTHTSFITIWDKYCLLNRKELTIFN